MLTSTNDANLRLSALRRGYALSKARPHPNRYLNMPCGYRISLAKDGSIVKGANFELTPQDVLDFLNTKRLN